MNEFKVGDLVRPKRHEEGRFSTTFRANAPYEVVEVDGPYIKISIPPPQGTFLLARNFELVPRAEEPPMEKSDELEYVRLFDTSGRPPWGTRNIWCYGSLHVVKERLNDHHLTLEDQPSNWPAQKARDCVRVNLVREFTLHWAAFLFFLANNPVRVLGPIRPYPFTRKQAETILLDHVMGTASHTSTGLCPGSDYPNFRDPDCAVCRALILIEGGEP